MQAEAAGDTVTLWLDRPERGNALGPALVEALEAGIDAALARGARLIVLRGRGRHFCTGLDLADLDAASLDDVKNWFRDNYAPNNAVLVLAGDVDVATARAKVQKYFGAIPRGRASVRRSAPLPTLPAAVNETQADRVAAPLVTRSWAVPGLNEADAAALEVAGGVLGGLSSSRLDNALVRQDKTAVQVSAFAGGGSQIGTFRIQAVVRPGADAAAALLAGVRAVAVHLGLTDFRTVFNTGAGVGQTVFHVHAHVLAGRPMDWPPG